MVEQQPGIFREVSNDVDAVESSPNPVSESVGADLYPELDACANLRHYHHRRHHLIMSRTPFPTYLHYSICVDTAQTATSNSLNAAHQRHVTDTFTAQSTTNMDVCPC
jgi:hypothetical protein